MLSSQRFAEALERVFCKLTVDNRIELMQRWNERDTQMFTPFERSHLCKSPLQMSIAVSSNGHWSVNKADTITELIDDIRSVNCDAGTLAQRLLCGGASTPTQEVAVLEREIAELRRTLDAKQRSLQMLTDNDPFRPTLHFSVAELEHILGQGSLDPLRKLVVSLKNVSNLQVDDVFCTSNVCATLARHVDAIRPRVRKDQLLRALSAIRGLGVCVTTCESLMARPTRKT